MASSWQKPVAPIEPMPPVAVTMGDPAGIGLDILITALSRDKTGELPSLVLVADPSVVAERARLLGCRIALKILAADAASLEPVSGQLTVLPVACAAPVIPGRPDAANGPATIKSIELSVRIVQAGRASALLTNPIAKHVLRDAGFAHPGHTEFLGELAHLLWGVAAHPVMMLVAPELKVVPVTVHMPLASVPSHLTQALIVEAGVATARALGADFGITGPRLAVCGLNPHAGEGGLLGNEERTVIAPAIEALRSAGISTSGPHSADTLFHAAARQTYDAVLAMYHDQGLIPLKTLAFDEGVNVTLGLPFVRTSPDHGTAFGIAGSGRATPTSFVAALNLAHAMARRRSGTQA